MQLQHKPPLFIGHPVFRRTGYVALHPLSIARVGPVMEISEMLGWLDAGNYREAIPASPETLTRYHDPAYIAALQRVSTEGKASREDRERFALGTMENPVFPMLFERVAVSVGGSILAARLALEGHLAFHPGGGTHHGLPARASGFCYANDPVFALLTLLEGGLTRIAYVDLDAHHGDGVELAFAADPRVLCISFHEAGRWPGTGQAHTPTARNFPVPRGFSDAGLKTLTDTGILPALRGFAPQAVVLTCGADVLAGDPLSGLMLSNTALWQAVQAIIATVPRAVILGGGGYNPWTTIRYWTGLWGVLMGQPMPARLPQPAQDLLAALSCDLVDDDDFNPAWITTLADPAPERSPAHEAAE